MAQAISVGMGGTNYLRLPIRLWPGLYFWAFTKIAKPFLYDTAASYGRGHLGERILGSYAGVRELNIVTKLGLSTDSSTSLETQKRWTEEFAAENLSTLFWDSLARLRSRDVFGLLLHCAGNGFDFSSHVQELQRLRRDGLTKRIGFSADTISQIPDDYFWADIIELNTCLLDDVAIRPGTVVILNRFCQTEGALGYVERLIERSENVHVVILLGSSRMRRVLACARKVRQIDANVSR